MENKKQEMLDELCTFLRKWVLKGDDEQYLSEIRYVKDEEGEWAIPIFSDGTGTPHGNHPAWKHGWYGQRINGNSYRGTFTQLVERWLPNVD